MEAIFIELGRSNLDLGHLGQVFLIVDAVAQHVTKIPQRPLQSIRRPLLLRLLEGSRLPLAILYMAISDIFVERAISERDSHDDGQTEGDLEGLGILVDEVNLYVLDARRPAVEAEDLVGQGDAFLGGDVVDFLTRRAAAG